MIAAMAKAPLPRFTESAINELFTARVAICSKYHDDCYKYFLDIL